MIWSSLGVKDELSGFGQLLNRKVEIKLPRAKGPEDKPDHRSSHRQWQLPRQVGK